MGYKKQNFSAGQVLTAEMLNNIEQGIVDNESGLEDKQPKGDYLTEVKAEETYQPKGDYLTEAKAKETYQPKGDYLTEAKAKETYQPKGTYLTEYQKLKTVNGQSIIGEGNIVLNENSNRYMLPNPVDKSVYSGMTIACIGDSVTAGVGADPNYVTNLGNELGATMKNLGSIGSVLCTGGNRHCNIGQLSVNNLKNADIVTILMGVNDWDQAGQGYYELGDINTTDTSTIYGAVRMWCEKIVELKKNESLANTKFYFMTPPITSWNHSMGSNSWDQNKVNIHGYRFRDLCQAIIDVCFEYEVPVIDLNLYSGIYYNSATDETTSLYGGDGIHPNTAGHEKITEAIIRAFERNPVYKPVADSVNYILDFLSKELGTELSYPMAVKEYVKHEVPLTGINLSVSELPLEAGATHTVTATLVPENTTQTNIAWESSNNTVATVKNGVITAVAEGNATITCKSVDNSAIYATIALSVLSTESSDLTALVMSDETITVEAGKTHTMTVTYVPASTDQKGVEWTTDNSNVATVEPSADGLSCVVTAVNEGQCYITVKSTVNPEISDRCLFTTSAAAVDDSDLYILGKNVSYDPSTKLLKATTGNYGGGVNNMAIYNVPLKAGMEVELQHDFGSGYSGFLAVGVDKTNDPSKVVTHTWSSSMVFPTGLVAIYHDNPNSVKNVTVLKSGNTGSKTVVAEGVNSTSPHIDVIRRAADGTLSGSCSGVEFNMPTHSCVTEANNEENLYVFICVDGSTWKINYFGELRN